MSKLSKFLLAVVLIMSCSRSFSQHQDSMPHIRKNIIKFNLTANSFLDNAILFEYERVLKNNQTVSIQAGYVEGPFSTFLDSTRLETSNKKSGWSITADYRFYLKKENKFAAPRGIYLAPFMSYHYFNDERTMEIQSESGTWEPAFIDSKVNLYSIGGEIGYQFIIKNRWSVDLILLGPSITNYNVNVNLTGNIPEPELDDKLQEILSGMLDKYPFIGDLLDDNTAEANGKVNTWDMGFRYSIHIGFCF